MFVDLVSFGTSYFAEESCVFMWNDRLFDQFEASPCGLYVCMYLTSSCIG
jgi:hypothetical protein